MYESQSQDARIAAADDAQSSFYDKLDALQTEAYAGLDEATATEEEYAAASEKVTKAQSALTEEEIATATADFTCHDKVMTAQHRDRAVRIAVGTNGWVLFFVFDRGQKLDTG